MAPRFMLFDRWGAYIRDVGEVIRATHTEELNGEDSLSVTTSEQLVRGQRIVWRDGMEVWHEHEVVGIEETHSDAGKPLTVAYCESSLCELKLDYVVDRRPSDPASALSAALSASRWEVGSCDVSGSGRVSMYHTSAYKALGAIVEKFGGEIRADLTVDPASGVTRRKVSLLSRRGSSTATRRFDYRADLAEVVRTTDESAVYTAVYAWGKGEELDSGGTGRRIGISGVTPDGLPYVHDDDAAIVWGRADGAHSFGEYLDESCTDPAELMQAAQTYLEQHSQPLVSYSATVEQYAQAGADLHGVALGDAVQVVDECFAVPVRIQARVVKIKTDLLDPKSASVTLGNVLPDVSTTYAQMMGAIRSLTNRSAAWDAVQEASEGYLDAVIAQLNAMFDAAGGYVNIDPATGITVMDASTFAAATSAINISGAGFRIANSKTAAGGWNWRTFGTGAGFTADEIVSGVIRATLIESDRLRARNVGISDTNYITTGVDLSGCVGSSYMYDDDEYYRIVRMHEQSSTGNYHDGVFFESLAKAFMRVVSDDNSTGANQKVSIYAPNMEGVSPEMQISNSFGAIFQEPYWMFMYNNGFFVMDRDNNDVLRNRMYVTDGQIALILGDGKAISLSESNGIQISLDSVHYIAIDESNGITCRVGNKAFGMSSDGNFYSNRTYPQT